MRSTLLVALSLAAAPAAPAQVTLEVQQSTTWTTELTIPEVQAMSFRWRWDGKPLASAAWQLAIIPLGTVPTATSTVAKQKNVPVPAKGAYAPFQILPADLPAGVTSNFYVRVQATTQGGMERVESAWVRVFIGSRSTTAYTPPATPPRLPAPDPPSFEIPGGGGVPLWVRFTKLIGDTETNDGSDSDEIYAVLLAEDLSAPAGDPAQLAVIVTPNFEYMDAGESRPANVSLWGPGGVAKPLRRPEDAIMLGMVMEADNGLGASWHSEEEEGGFIRDALLPGLLGLRRRNASREEIRNYLSAMLQYEVSRRNTTNPCLPSTCTNDERVGNYTKGILFTAEQLAAAANGGVAKTEVSFGRSGSSEGKYILRFQLGKSGISTVSW